MPMEYPMDMGNRKNPIALTKEKFLKAIKKYNKFLDSNTFQYAREGTKKYAYVDRRTGLLEDTTRDAFEAYKKEVLKGIERAFNEYAQMIAAEGEMRRWSHDLWDKKVNEDMRAARREPERFVYEIILERVKEELRGDD